MWWATCILMLFISGTIGIAANPPAQPKYPLTDTTQGNCYNNTKIIPCPTEGEPFYGQDANYRGNFPRFVIDENNEEGDFDDTVFDENTNLEWERVHGDVDHDDIFSSGDWVTMYEAMGYCYDLSLGGYIDWRLPTMHELESIVDYTAHYPNFDESFFSGYSNSYVTSSHFRAIIQVNFINGNVVEEDTTPAPVRCVRGRDIVPPDYVEEEYTYQNETYYNVYDLNTGLGWGKNFFDIVREVSWEEALRFCEKASFGGYDDWRLPNIRELLSLVFYGSLTDLTINEIFEVNLPVHVSYYNIKLWSSTTADHEIVGMPGGHPEAARTVSFYRGISSYHPKSDQCYFKCVRGGNVRSGQGSPDALVPLLYQLLLRDQGNP